MHKKLAITLAAGVLLLGGCQDELLEKQPVDKFSEEMVNKTWRPVFRQPTLSLLNAKGVNIFGFIA